MELKKKLKIKWQRLYIKIVKEKAPPEYIARGWAIGMFCGCFIPFGFQLIISVPASFFLKGSKVGAVLGTLLTNQVTIFFIYPVQCYVGSRILGGDLTLGAVQNALKDLLAHQNYETLFSLSGHLIAAFFVGGALLTAVCTPITYFGVKAMVKNYRKLMEAKKRANAERLSKRVKHLTQVIFKKKEERKKKS